MTDDEKPERVAINLRDELERVVAGALRAQLAGTWPRTLVPGCEVAFIVTPAPNLHPGIGEAVVVSELSARSEVALIVRAPGVDDLLTEAVLVEWGGDVAGAVVGLLSRLHDEVGRRRSGQFVRTQR